MELFKASPNSSVHSNRCPLSRSGKTRAQTTVTNNNQTTNHQQPSQWNSLKPHQTAACTATGSLLSEEGRRAQTTNRHKQQPTITNNQPSTTVTMELFKASPNSRVHSNRFPLIRRGKMRVAYFASRSDPLCITIRNPLTCTSVTVGGADWVVACDGSWWRWRRLL